MKYVKLNIFQLATLVAILFTQGSLQAEEWNELRDKLDGMTGRYDRPIASLQKEDAIPDAPLAGGGNLTVTLDGDHRGATFYVTKSDFWVGVMQPENLFLRARISPSPFVRLHMEVKGGSDHATGFEHVQDMAGAEIRSSFPVEGGSLSVRTLAIAQKGLVLFELTARNRPVSLAVNLESDNERKNFFIARGVRDKDTVYLRKEHKSFINVNAAAALRVLGAAKTTIVSDNMHDPAVEIEVEPGKPAWLVLAAAGGKDEFHPLDEALAMLKAARVDALSQLVADHQAWWRDYWMKSWVDLGDPVLERFYYGALYVLGTSLDLDSRVTPGLAGGWITTTDLLWGGTYTMNYNGQAPFWGLVSANRGEWLLPYARVCLDYIPTGRVQAKETGTGGIVFPVMIGPWGVEDIPDALGQKGNASLASLSLISHQEHYRDPAFLQDYAYPLVREVADFWEKNIEIDARGRCVIHGAARERDPGDLNPINDLAYARRVLGAAIAFSKELQVDAERRARWKKLIDGLSDYPTIVVDGKICFSESENRQVVGTMGEPGTLGVGDNPVVLDHVYPGGALDTNRSGKLKMIARNTLRYLDSWGQYNAFPRIFSQAARAEYPGKELLDIFRKRIGGGGKGKYEHLRANNSFLPADHAYEGAGAIEFINYLLANGQGGVIRIFELWPKDRDAAFHRLRVPGAFLVSASLRKGEVSEVDIVSENGSDCRMASCWPGYGIEVSEISNDGKSNPIDVESKDGVASWKTKIESRYRVTKGHEVTNAKGNPPVMLVPIVEPHTARSLDYTKAAIDVLLTPEQPRAKIRIELVRDDESSEEWTPRSSFRSLDESVASVSEDGLIRAVGSGWATIAVASEVEGEMLTSRVRTYVMRNNVVPAVMASSPDSTGGPGNSGWKNRPECLVGSGGTDGPDITARHRANGYRVGMYHMDSKGEDAVLVFDLGKTYTLDQMWVWNFNAPENYRIVDLWSGGLRSGMRDVAIEYSNDGEKWTALKDGQYPFRLAIASGKQWMPATNLDDGKQNPIRFDGVRARYVRLRPNPEVGVGNWGGQGFGLSEVKFTYLPDLGGKKLGPVR